jgi:menaquinone-dependent protoporphyrinogen oxidase
MTTLLDHAVPRGADRRNPWPPRSTSEPDTGGPRVLVTFASRHGSTREIAAALARALQRTGSGRHPHVRIVLAPVQRRPDPRDFDAVVLGSPVYADGWLESARSYADAVAAHLCGRPTWLFSSGLTTQSAEEVRRIGPSIGARDHRIFGGRLEPRLLSAAERRDWPVGGAEDVRNWSAVREWSAQIVTELARRPAASGAG